MSLEFLLPNSNIAKEFKKILHEREEMVARSLHARHTYEDMAGLRKRLGLPSSATRSPSLEEVKNILVGKEHISSQARIAKPSREHHSFQKENFQLRHENNDLKEKNKRLLQENDQLERLVIALALEKEIFG